MQQQDQYLSFKQLNDRLLRLIQRLGVKPPRSCCTMAIQTSCNFKSKTTVNNLIQKPLQQYNRKQLYE